MGAGSKLGRYELLARIATGGMGEIFLARLEGAAGFEKLCVIKRILPHLADDGRFRQMLIDEARIASNMSHANICHVYELDEIAGQLYLVMEYLEGVTLLQLLRTMSQRGHQLELGVVAGVVQQACEGLHYAHELRDRNGGSLGVVHRDVTPSNLFLTESGVVKIVDFGVAKAKDSVETNSGEIKGKYAYMAPEQLRGQDIDRRVDVFSLGVVVFEMLTCRRLYQRKTDYLTFRAVMSGPQVNLARHRRDAPPAVTQVLRRALARDPAERYATVRQLGDSLLEAFGDVRPWGQGALSELVRTAFAEDLSLHNAEISRVVRRTTGDDIPVIQRRTADADGSDYLSIETDVGDQPVPGGESPLFSGGIGTDPGDVPSAPFGQAIRVAAQPSQLASVSAGGSPRPHAPRRAGVLPLAGIVAGAAAVLIAGLAFVGGRAPHRAAEPGAALGATPGSAPGSASAGELAAAIDPGRAHHRPAREPYGAAISGHEHELDVCARDHHDPLPAGARAVIVIGVDGRARTIALEPATTDHTALGSCIRSVLQAVAFPAGPDEKQLALGLAVY